MGEEWTSIGAHSAPAWVCPDGVHSAAVPLPPRCPFCRTKNGHGHFSEWTEVRAVLTALANTTLDAACYICTVSWVSPMTWLLCLRLRKQAGTLKTPLYRVTTHGNELIELRRSLLWVPIVGVYSLLRPTGVPSPIAAWTCHPSRRSHTRTLRDLPK